MCFHKNLLKASLSRLVLHRSKVVPVDPKVGWQDLKLRGVPVPICGFNPLGNRADERYHYYHTQRQLFLPVDAVRIQNVIVPTFTKADGSIIWSGQGHGGHEYNLGIQHEFSYGDDNQKVQQIGVLEVGSSQVEMNKLAIAAGKSIDDLVGDAQSELGLPNKMRIYDTVEEKVKLKNYELYPFAVEVLTPFLSDGFSSEKIIIKTGSTYGTYYVMDSVDDNDGDEDDDAASDDLKAETEVTTGADGKQQQSVRASGSKIMEVKLGQRNKGISASIQKDSSKVAAVKDTVLKARDIIRVKIRPSFLYFYDLPNGYVSFIVMPTSCGLEEGELGKYIGFSLDKAEYYAKGTGPWNHRLMMGVMRKADISKCHHIVNGKPVQFSNDCLKLFGTLPRDTTVGLDVINFFQVS